MPEWLEPVKSYLVDNCSWIPRNWTWSKIKPVIRCAVVGWVSMVLFVIPQVERTVGSAAFLILIVAFLMAPSEPFIATAEREILFLFMCSLMWAWCCLGIFLADLARHVRVPHATLAQVIDGKYIEAAPSVIIGIFIFFGSALLLWFRANRGPGPFFIACVFAALTMDICLTTAVLFPFPFYLIGSSIMIPLSLHSALSLLGCLVIFPSTITAQFTSSLSISMGPVLVMLAGNCKLLATSISSPDFSPLLVTVKKDTKSCESSLVPLANARRLLKGDWIYGRFSPKDFVAFQGMLKRLAARADGLSVYFSLVDPSREKFPGTMQVTPVPTTFNSPRGDLSRATSRAPSRAPSRPPSRPPSIGERPSENPEQAPEEIPASPTSVHRLSHAYSHHKHPHSKSHSTTHSHLFLHDSVVSHHRHHSHNERHSHGLHHRLLHSSLMDLRLKREEYAVGTFESQRYMNLESTGIFDPFEFAQWNEKIQGFCTPLLEACSLGMTTVRDWMMTSRDGRATTREIKRKERVKKIREVRDLVAEALRLFRTQERHGVVEPYRPAFEDGEYDPQRHGHLFSALSRPPARCLFHSFIYQYSLMQITSIILEMLDEILRLEEVRMECRLWTPLEHIRTTSWNLWTTAETVDPNTEDDDPDFIQGRGQPDVSPTPVPRSNDADMPSKISGPAFFVTPDVDLGIPKRRDPDHLPPRNLFETVMTVVFSFVLSLGTGNALFALKGGFLSVALSLPSLIKYTAQFAYVNRFVWGIFMGQMALARFQGDTYFALWARAVSTFFGAIVGTVIWYIACGSGSGNPFGLAAVAAVCFPFFFYGRLYWPIPPLRVGYSYQDTHLGSPGNPGHGWSIAWKRFVLVTSGVSASFFASFLPPATTIRRYHRSLLATTSSEIGTLGRLTAMRANVGYEVSLQGRWPADRYQKIVDIQTALSYSLSHLMSVLEHLDPAWSRAFLRRTRFMDPDFQGDVLAVIWCPLPQITPCPLADRFMLKYHGLSVIHKDSEEDYGLPRRLSIETLKNEQYLMFSVGITTAFGIVNRLDRLMVAVKEVVGEQYHIHGIEIAEEES
ncbi:hypothetical protein CPB84DRAFT_1815176 [Gymnopilus junonius]|uniref:ER transporter 6TM N-terminal domain-containing protein n=1 Tax=Gymnopilus junonius TaxID=109634 RepID=A0A9P5NRE7_GYMJU|nr:hypothetical protein CPB84DRAFT_1815176 [Gymnopilus junonius]